MTTLEQLLARGQAGLTVYSPDGVQSRLVGSLDRTIRDRAGLDVVFRRWISLDHDALRRFYGSALANDPGSDAPAQPAPVEHPVPPEQLTPAHLLATLYGFGPALLTIWRGEDPIRALARLKGVTHPAAASPDTIRGRFWCDNPVCNLMHASDDTSELERELGAIGLSGILALPATTIASVVPEPHPWSHVSHSGVVLLCAVVNRLLAIEEGAEPLVVTLPEDGDARTTMRTCGDALEQVTRDRPGSPAASLIEDFLRGNVAAFVGHSARVPATGWERFVLLCSAISRRPWNAGVRQEGAARPRAR